MMWRRRLNLVFLFLLTACQPATLNPTRTPSLPLQSTMEPTSTADMGSQLGVNVEALKGITVQVWHPWFGVEASLFDSQVTDFNQTNPWGITIQATSQATYTELFQNVTTSLPTADRPQLVIAFPEHALAWDADNYVTDLTKYVNDPEFGLTATDVKDFPAVLWSQDTIAGKRLGVPAERSARFLLYNSSWARELGFDSPPSNSDDLRKQACRAHQSMASDKDRTNDGQGGWLIDTSSTTFLSWMMAFGGGVLEGNNYRFLTPKNLAALTFVKQLYDDGCAWSAQAGADLPAAFAGRKALFATAGMEDFFNYLAGMASANNPDQWSVLSFPGNEQNGLLVYGSSYVVLKSTPEEQLASWLFVRWLLAPERQKRWVEVTGLFPLRTSSLDLLGDYKNSHPQWVEAVALLPQAQIEPQLASWREVRVMLGDGFDAMFRANTPAGRVAEVLAIMESTSRDLSK